MKASLLSYWKRNVMKLTGSFKRIAMGVEFEGTVSLRDAFISDLESELRRDSLYKRFLAKEDIYMELLRERILDFLSKTGRKYLGSLGIEVRLHNGTVGWVSFGIVTGKRL